VKSQHRGQEFLSNLRGHTDSKQSLNNESVPILLKRFLSIEKVVDNNVALLSKQVHTYITVGIANQLSHQFDSFDPKFRSLLFSSENSIAMLQNIIKSIALIKTSAKKWSSSESYFYALHHKLSNLSDMLSNSPDSHNIREIKNIIMALKDGEDLSKKAFDNPFSLVYDKLEENQNKTDNFFEQLSNKLTPDPGAIPSSKLEGVNLSEQLPDLFATNKQNKDKGKESCHSNTPNILLQDQQLTSNNIFSCHAKISLSLS
jgi:hypothetical protein